MEIMYGNRVYIFCSDDFKARQSIASLETPVHCISILGVFYKLMRMGKKKSEMQEYYDHLAAFLKTRRNIRFGLYLVINEMVCRLSKYLMKYMMKSFRCCGMEICNT